MYLSSAYVIVDLGVVWVLVRVCVGVARADRAPTCTSTMSCDLTSHASKFAKLKQTLCDSSLVPRPSLNGEKEKDKDLEGLRPRLYSSPQYYSIHCRYRNYKQGRGYTGVWKYLRMRSSDGSENCATDKPLNPIVRNNSSLNVYSRLL